MLVFGECFVVDFGNFVFDWQFQWCCVVVDWVGFGLVQLCGVDVGDGGVCGYFVVVVVVWWLIVDCCFGVVGGDGIVGCML